MIKLITIFIIVYITVLAQTAITNNIESFLDAVRYQHERNIQNYDTQIEVLKQSMDARVNTATITSQLLINTIEQATDNLKPFQVMNDESKRCVDTYSRIIPTQRSTTASAKNCIAISEDSSNILYYPNYYRSTLNSYYINTFETSVSKCKKGYSNPNNCILKAAESSEAYTTLNQQYFNQNLANSFCSAENNIRTTLSCIFNLENNTISAIAEANVNINQCIWGKDSCKDLATASTCSEIKYIPQSQVSTTAITMTNPYYGKDHTSNCLILKIV